MGCGVYNRLEEGANLTPAYVGCKWVPILNNGALYDDFISTHPFKFQLANQNATALPDMVVVCGGERYALLWHGGILWWRKVCASLTW